MEKLNNIWNTIFKIFSKEKCAIITAIMYLIFTIASFWGILSELDAAKTLMSFSFYSFDWVFIASCDLIASFMLAVIFFRIRIKKFLLIPLGVFIIGNFFAYCGALFLYLIYFYIICSSMMPKYKDSTYKSIFILPMIFLVLWITFDLIILIVNIDFMFKDFLIFYRLAILAEPLGLIFMSLWLASDMKNKPPKNNKSKQMLGSADKLMHLKELLDSGIITSEEFDKKKKEILDN